MRITLLFIVSLITFSLTGQNSVKNTTVMSNCTTCSGTYSWNTSAVWHPTVGFSGVGFAKDLQTTNYGFNIPLSATIVGIVTNFQYTTEYSSPNVLRDTLVSLLKGGVVVGVNKSNLTPTYHATMVTQVNLGSPTDLWGTTWTPSDINASNFGFNLKLYSYQPNTMMKIWQGLIITVYYSTSTGIIKSQSSAGLKGRITSHDKKIHLSNFEDLQNSTIEIFDLTGKSILRTNSIETNSIDISGLTSGIYFCRLSNHKENVTQKFIVN